MPNDTFNKPLTNKQGNDLAFRLGQLFGDNPQMTESECIKKTLNVINEFVQELSEAQIEQEMKKEPEERNPSTFDSLLSSALKLGAKNE